MITEKENNNFVDLFGRNIEINDICVRIQTSTWSSNAVSIVKIQDLSKQKVKVGEKTYVLPNKLIKLSIENLDLNNLESLKKRI